MKVFLTGASGYVGKHVALELLARGHAVTGLARKASDRTKYSDDVQWCYGDLTDSKAYLEPLMQCHAVVHCAMDYSSSGENSALDLQFVESLREYPGHLLYTGNLFSDRAQDSLPESPLLTSKHWRFRSEVAVLNRKSPSSVVRLGFVYGGTGGYFWQILSPGALAGLSQSDIPNVTWPMVHVRDVATLYALILERGATGVFHGYDGNEIVAAEVISHTRSLYESMGVCESESHDYINGLLQTSVRTSNHRSRSVGWRPMYPSFPESAEDAYLEFTNRSR